MHRKHNRISLPLVMGLLALLGSESPMAANAPTGNVDLLCKSARIFERMVSDICWTCVFPMRVAGVDVGGTSPSGANKDPVCSCDTPIPGISMGSWMPKKLAEAVKTPGCSPSLYGARLPLGSETELGAQGKHNNDGHAKENSFRHVHYFHFPVGEILGLIQGCAPGGGDFGLSFATEMVPTWNNDLLAFIVNSETALFANPAAQAACTADAMAVGIGGREPFDSLFWCAGSWGNMYPMTGNVSYSHSGVEATSLQSARFLGQIHRWGMAFKTMGNACGGVIHPTIPRRQYKFQQYWPMPEANNNHYIGESLFRWGPHRNQMGEDYLHLIWRWDDCCLEVM